MQHFLLVFVLFIDYYIILTRQNPLYRSINISLLNNTDNSISNITIGDFDNSEIHIKLNDFIKWFTPILVIFSVFIALICPFLLWILQERCLYRSSINRNSQPSIVITTPRLLLIDPRIKLQKSQLPSLNSTPYNSVNSSNQKTSYHTPRTSSSSSVNTMV